MKHARKDYDRIQDPAGLIPESEPVFLIRGKDKLAPATLRRWANLAAIEGADENIVKAALAQADEMERYQAEYGAKIPDMPRDA